MSAIVRQQQIGPCLMIQGDAVAVATELSDRWHAVIADPPYGINYTYKENRVLGDDRPYDPRPLLALAGKRPLVLWGGNHYASRLPDTGGWLAWQKLPDALLGRLSFSDGEFAWYSWNRRSRFKRHTWSGMIRAGSHAANGRTRFHLTQKPVEIMRWCIDMLPANGAGWGDTVIDPYMGSGSTAIAAIDAGVQFIGVEMSAKWFDIACERVSQYWEQAKCGHEI